MHTQTMPGILRTSQEIQQSSAYISATFNSPKEKDEQGGDAMLMGCL
jgi:hypothetical protein